MVVEYLITIKTSAIKKLDCMKESTKNLKYFFVKFQASFSQKTINIQLYISCKAFIRSIA